MSSFPDRVTRFDDVFTSRVTPHLGRMHAAARRVLGRDDLASDVVQDVLVRVWSNRRLPEHDAEALAGLAYRGALASLRAQRRRTGHEDAAAHLCTPSCPCREPLVELESSELRAEILAALEGLPAEQRDAFVAFELEGHDYASIAERSGAPVGTVRSRLARARAALRDALGARTVAA